MLREAFRYPTRGDDAVETFLIGGGLHLAAALVLPLFFPLALVPLVFVAGYLVRVLDHVASTDPPELRGDVDPPTFSDPVRLFREGLVAAVVTVVYLVVPVAMLLITVGGAMTRRAQASSLGFGGTLGFLGGSIVTLLIVISIVYFLPAGLVAYASTRRVRAAFEWRRLKRFGGRGTYFFAFWVSIAVGALVAAAVGPLNTVALGFFVLFYAEVVVAALCGQACADPSPATSASVSSASSVDS